MWLSAVLAKFGGEMKLPSSFFLLVPLVFVSCGTAGPGTSHDQDTLTDSANECTSDLVDMECRDGATETADSETVQCSYPPDFCCLLQHLDPKPHWSTITARFTARFPGDYFAPVAGLTVRFCRFNDMACEKPVTQAVTDSNGAALMELPTSPIGVDGYFELVGEDWFPNTLYFFSFTNGARTLGATGGNLDAVVYSLLELKAVEDGFPFLEKNPSRGVIAIRIEDCLGERAAGVSISTDAADSESVIRYNRHGIPLPVSESQVDGNCHMFNILPGASTLTARLGTDGCPVGKMNIVVRQGWLTFARITPTRP